MKLLEFELYWVEMFPLDNYWVGVWGLLGTEPGLYWVWIPPVKEPWLLLDGYWYLGIVLVFFISKFG